MSCSFLTPWRGAAVDSSINRILLEDNFFAFTTRLGPRRMVRAISRYMMGQDPALRDPKEVEESMRKLREAKKINA